MNNSLTTLAFSIYSNKGVYALLLGSGISKTSGIPTGWEVVIDLIRKLAKQNGIEEELEDPEKWFWEQYEEEPDYSNLLYKLTKKQTERVELMRPYFEASETEREENFKQPTEAHRNIAQLAKKGYLKVIVTTNFDRLMEKALEEEGLTFRVIRNVHDIEAALPIIHAPLTIVKINGDYLDCGFLNTKEELREYPEKLSDLLLRIINEFGLITCGWSGIWDTALIKTLHQSQNFRYNSFFTHVGKCETQLSDLANKRKGETLQIEGADKFFYELNERIEALEKFNSNHPLNKDIAIARIKKYIAKPEYLIPYTDCIEKETDRIYDQLYKDVNLQIDLTPETFEEIFLQYQKSLEIILPMLITTVRWAKTEHEEAIINLIERMGNFPQLTKYYRGTENLYGIPCALLYYSIGISCILYKKYSLLNQILNSKIKTQPYHYEAQYLLPNIHPMRLIHTTSVVHISQNRNNYLFVNDKIYNHLKPLFNEITKSEAKFEAAFNIFEYLLSIQYRFLTEEDWNPWGRYQRQELYPKKSIQPSFTEFFNEADILQNEWPPLKAGLFNGKYDIFDKTRKETDSFLNGMGRI